MQTTGNRVLAWAIAAIAAGCSWGALAPLARFEDPVFPGVHAPTGAPVDLRFDRAMETGDELAMTVAYTRTARAGRTFSGDGVVQRERRARLSCRLVVLGVNAQREPSLVEVLVSHAEVNNVDPEGYFAKAGDDEPAIPAIADGTRATLSISPESVGVQRVNNQPPDAPVAALFVKMFSGSTLDALTGSVFGDVRARRLGEHWVVGTTAMPASAGVRRVISYNARLDWRGRHEGADSVRLIGWAISPEFTTGRVGEDMVRHRVVLERSLLAPIDGQRLPFVLRERRTVDAVGYATETVMFRNGGAMQERVPRAESLIELIEVSYGQFIPAPRSRPNPNRVEGGDGEGVATK
ncbi:MAG: hypothetical protein U0269_16050 [Polyangiales bacterium]